MGTTPQLALPYPENTDRVMDGNAAVQALAEAVEAAVTDVTVIPVTLAAGVIAYGAPYASPNVLVTPAGEIRLQGMTKRSASSASTQTHDIGTIPLQYAPQYDRRFRVDGRPGGPGSGTSVVVVVSAAGQVTAYSDSSVIWSNTTGQWVSLDGCSWLVGA